MLYAVVFIIGALICRFRQTKLRIPSALVLTLAMCLFHRRADVSVTQRYFASMTCMMLLDMAMEDIIMLYYCMVMGDGEDLAFSRVELHLPFCFPFSKFVYVSLKCSCITVVYNGLVHHGVISKKRLPKSKSSGR